jgi:hypothetical protein
VLSKNIEDKIPRTTFTCVMGVTLGVSSRKSRTYIDSVPEQVTGMGGGEIRRK